MEEKVHHRKKHHRSHGKKHSSPPAKNHGSPESPPPDRRHKHRSPESPPPRAYRQRSPSLETPPHKSSKRRRTSPDSLPHRHSNRRHENGNPKRHKEEEDRNHRLREDETRRRDRPRRTEDNDRQGTRRRDEEERRRHNVKREKNPNRYEWGGRAVKEEPQENQPPQPPKEKPNLEASGKLAEDSNVYNGVVIKYSEPEDARKPKRRWRLYRFKGETEMPMIQLHRQSAYLFGRQRLVADIPIDHPSCSKQHAVLQFRLVPYQRPDGTKSRRVRPYMIDLDSSNGTYINNKRIDPSRYVELIEMDVIKFGYSSREYVILHEDLEKNEVNPTADEEFQDDNKEAVEEPAKNTTEET